MLGKNLLELRYEDVTSDPVGSMKTLLAFSGLGDDMSLYSAQDTHLERNQYREVLSDEDKLIVQDRSSELASHYGYSLGE